MTEPRSTDPVLIIANYHRPETANFAKEVASYIESLGKTAQIFGFEGKASLPNNGSVSLGITLGGDGTVLFAARALSPRGVPILPINLGNFGFITEVGKDDWQEDLASCLAGNSACGTRLMISVRVFRKSDQIFESACLNDAVISGAGISKILSLTAYLSSTEIGKYRADGIIVATPTGSTAYSAAAGGPILHPEIDAMILNPICPFTLSHRPLVLPGGEVVRIRVDKEQRTNVILTIDGQIDFPLQPEDVVEVRRAEFAARILYSKKRNFYEVLRTKLNWAGGPDA